MSYFNNKNILKNIYLTIIFNLNINIWYIFLFMICGYNKERLKEKKIEKITKILGSQVWGYD